MHHVDHLTVASCNYAALDQVLQLTNVARKAIRQQRVNQPGTEACDMAPMTATEMAQKVAHQQRNIFASLPQWRQVNREHIQPIEQVLAKTASLHFVAQVKVGRGDNPHIHLNGRSATYPFNFTFLQGAQDLALRTEAQGGNFVEEQCPAMGALKASGTRTLSARKSTALDPKQFGLHQVLRQGGAVEGHQRHVRTSAGLIQRAGEQLFADPRLTCQQHSRLS